MALVDLVMPKMGESIMEATILKWHKQPGESILQDETLLEIATDKVDSEVPSAAAGVVEEILFKENEVVPIGSVIARVRTSTSASQPEAAVPASPVRSNSTPSSNGYPPDPARVHAPGSNRFYSPLVLTIASNEGISPVELETIAGTGNEGRVTKKDILQYVSDKKSGLPAREGRLAETSAQAAGPEAKSPPNAQPLSSDPAVEIIEMDRMRRLIADHMVRSKQISAHVTSFAEADVTNLVHWRERVKKDFEKREGTKLTFTPLFIESIVRCIKKYPLVNSSVDGDRILVRKQIHIGMATALPTGNLIVPVIRNTDQFNLVGLARQVNQLADDARNGGLRPEDTQGGTFTVTNVGTFGSLMGTPIINQPQVAILALGIIKKRPVVIETDLGDSIAIRHMIYLSLSYDHRIVDGSVGASFLSEVARDLEGFNPSKEY
jgi:2-oxoglutarate dehydrogenase E2 component (dihydrolipoamide succinyltransferase)